MSRTPDRRFARTYTSTWASGSSPNVPSAVVTAGLFVRMAQRRRSRSRHEMQNEPLWIDVAVTVLPCVVLLAFAWVMNSYQITSKTEPQGIPIPVLIWAGVAVVLSFLVHRTRFGLNIRAVGENPEAADVAGIPIFSVRYATLIAGGALMGLAGAFLSLAQLGAFTFGIIAGRGWIAIALVIFGNWQPGKVLLGTLLFGALQAVQLRLQAEGVTLVPYEVLLAMPYVLTIAALAFAGRAASAPAAMLKPYRRE